MEKREGTEYQEPLKSTLTVSSFSKETPIPLIQTRIPALSGPHRDRPWVGVLRKLTEVGYY
ncbi:MAG: hypothetical protein MUP69_01225 [Candidatus Atribacteria bacterium]|nr:hypothetical protein [Candidatus Atribacteria bacterium]